MAKSKAITVGKEDFGTAMAVPSYLQDAPSVLDDVDIQQNLARITLNNKGRFQLMDGASEVQKLGDSVQIRFLHVHPTMQRRWYEGDYDEDSDEMQIPSCWSNDGVEPDEASVKPQHANCKNCPLNQPGSGGGKRKACGQSRNTLVQLLDDSPMNNDPLLYKINATSHYADPSNSEDGSMGFSKLTKLADRNGLVLQAYPVEVTSDKDGEMGQANFFVINEPATEAEFKEIQATRASLDMVDMVSLSYTPISDDNNAEEEPEQREAPTRQARGKKTAAKASAKSPAAAKGSSPSGKSGATEEPDDGAEEEEEAVQAAPPARASRARRGRNAPAASPASEEEADTSGDDDGDEPNDVEVNKFLDGLDDI